MTLQEKKDLCAVSYALQDFEDGKHVDTLLQPLEEGRNLKATLHWAAIRSKLRSTAHNIASDRRHNKFHSVLAIIVYGKDVFVALIQAKFDESFPYHMPHTLALRQLYYWLFCAIILSAAAGGFADQWSSHAFLNEFLQARLEKLRTLAEQRAKAKPNERPFTYDDIQLKLIELWNGGNYSWKYPKRGRQAEMTPRKIYLLLLVVAAVAFPVAIAFIMSWYTPTTGLGRRGIMEVSFAGMWGLNWIITMVASLKRHGKELFRIYIWNTFWSFGSLYILFGAFQGWYNNCASWSAYYSRGPSAFIDLDMKDAIEARIFTFYLPMTGISWELRGNDLIEE